MTTLSADAYRVRYGATTGDRVRLGDTDLWVRVREDRTARGDEPVWGYAKNLRSRMAQSDSAAGPSELDIVIPGALVIDPVIGVVKADIGIKDGRIAGIGCAGSPEISDGIDLVIGPHTKSRTPDSVVHGGSRGRSLSTLPVVPDFLRPIPLVGFMHHHIGDNTSAHGLGVDRDLGRSRPHRIDPGKNPGDNSGVRGRLCIQSGRPPTLHLRLGP